MTPADLRDLLTANSLGVLATIKSDGRPQLSPVSPHYDCHRDALYVSMRSTSAKAMNLRRDDRATLVVTRPDGRAWVTAEGRARLIGPGTDAAGPEVQALVDYYRAAAEEHPDWDEYRAVMVAERRVLMVMSIDRVYGADFSRHPPAAGSSADAPRA